MELSKGTAILLARATLFTWLVLVASFLAAAGSPTVDFATEIQPIFRASCYTCHQGDKAVAGLHLDSRAAVGGGVSGKPLVPGRSQDSLILKRLLSPDPRARWAATTTRAPSSCGWPEAASSRE
jgi:Planctomycete cytochrome C